MVDDVNQSIAHCYSFAKLWKVFHFFNLLYVRIYESCTVSFIHCTTFFIVFENEKCKFHFIQQDPRDKGNVKQEKTALSDDEDDEDEPLLKSDMEAHYECGFTSVYINAYIFIFLSRLYCTLIVIECHRMYRSICLCLRLGFAPHR